MEEAHTVVLDSLNSSNMDNEKSQDLLWRVNFQILQVIDPTNYI